MDEDVRRKLETSFLSRRDHESRFTLANPPKIGTQLNWIFEQLKINVGDDGLVKASTENTKPVSPGTVEFFKVTITTLNFPLPRCGFALFIM